ESGVKHESAFHQCGSSSFKAVAHAAERLDEITIVAKLTPYRCDMDIHGPFGDFGVFATHGIDNLIAREHPSRSTGQKVQDVNLCRSQLHQLVPQTYFVASRVDDNVIIDDGGFGAGVALLAAQHRFDPGQEHTRAEGFGEIIVGPDLEPSDDIRVFT